MWVTALPLLLGAAMAPIAALADEPCSLVLTGAAARIDGELAEAALRFFPAEIEAGTPFAIEVSICGSGKPTVIQVDAHMPAHRHGMNYKPRLTETGPGRYRAEGFLFHMPGQWEVFVDVRSGERSERLAHRLAVE